MCDNSIGCPKQVNFQAEEAEEGRRFKCIRRLCSMSYIRITNGHFFTINQKQNRDSSADLTTRL